MSRFGALVLVPNPASTVHGGECVPKMTLHVKVTPNPNKRVGIYVKSGKARRRRPAGGEENLAVSDRDFRIPAAALGCSPATHPLTRTYSEAAS